MRKSSDSISGCIETKQFRNFILGGQLFKHDWWHWSFL